MKRFCKKGHDTSIHGRNNSYHCKECSRNISRRYFNLNREVCIERSKKYKNKEKVIYRPENTIGNLKVL